MRGSERRAEERPRTAGRALVSGPHRLGRFFTQRRQRPQPIVAWLHCSDGRQPGRRSSKLRPSAAGGPSGGLRRERYLSRRVPSCKDLQPCNLRAELQTLAIGISKHSCRVRGRFSGMSNHKFSIILNRNTMSANTRTPSRAARCCDIGIPAIVRRGSFALPVQQVKLNQVDLSQVSIE